MKILGISAYYHDSAASLLIDGKLVAAAQEERFTRIKHDERFPANAAAYCLQAGGIAAGELDAVAFYDKPLSKFGRIMETYRAVAPGGLASFMKAVPAWFGEKLWVPAEIETAMERIGHAMPERLIFAQHHESHAASAFFPSPFEEAVILTLDGVGEWATSSIAVGRGNTITMEQELRFPHSLGLLYSAFTYFAGFRVNSGEYKLMGLAPYGEPKYVQTILENLIDLKDDGSFRLNMKYFGFLTELRMTNEPFAGLFGGPARKPESRITRREMDLAKSIQVVTEEIVLRIARHARKTYGISNVCLAGGVALNCVANGKLLAEGIFDHLWIQPAAGDAGGAIGAAYVAYHHAMKAPRVVQAGEDAMQGSYLGPAFGDVEIGAWLKKQNYPAIRLDDEEEWAETIASELADEKVVGLHQGRMEFGPRSLGNRSILGDPRSPAMQSIMNLKIKYRESFRPFAPSVLSETADQYFELKNGNKSPYMLLVAPLKKERCLQPQGQRDDEDLISWINQARSDLPSVTHVDFSARIQTVDAKTNPSFHRLIKAFGEKTGVDVLINTSFNVRGEPIVCTPEDAYRCFMRTEMDLLVLGSWLLRKEEQPKWSESSDWRQEFALD